MTARKDKETAPMQVSGQQDRPQHYQVMMSGQQYLIVKHTHVWRPPTDVVEENDHLLVIVEIAGMQNGEFHVQVTSQRLVVSGVRPRTARSSAAYHQLEVRSGEFRTEVALPWMVDEEKIKAWYDDGFLRVELPRAAAKDVRVIAVDKEASDLVDENETA